MKNTILTVLVFFAFLGICSSAWAGGDRDVDVLVYTGNYKYDEAAKMITLDGKEIKGKLAGNYKLRKVKFAT